MFTWRYSFLKMMIRLILHSPGNHSIGFQLTREGNLYQDNFQLEMIPIPGGLSGCYQDG